MAVVDDVTVYQVQCDPIGSALGGVAGSAHPEREIS